MSEGMATTYHVTPAGNRLAYHELGQGEEVLLFLHGMSSNRKAWQKNVSVFQDNYKCILIDLPGHGESDPLPSKYDLHLVAQQVLDFIVSKEITQIHLVGHSMGGLISMEMALINPSLIQKIILAAPAGLEPFTDGEVELISTYYTGAFIEAYSKQMITKNFELNFYQLPDDARFMISDKYELKKDAERYSAFCHTAAACTYAIVTSNLIDRIHELEASVLMFFGDHDKLIPHHIMHPTMNTKDIAEAAVAKMKAARLVVYEQCGHFVQWEKADRFNEECLQFLSA